MIECQLLVPLPDRYDDLDERPAQRGPPNTEECIVGAGWEPVLNIVSDAKDWKDGETKQVVDDHVKGGVED